jgi:hypothetical protein
MSTALLVLKRLRQQNSGQVEAMLVTFYPSFTMVG